MAHAVSEKKNKMARKIKMGNDVKFKHRVGDEITHRNFRPKGAGSTLDLRK